jgi:Arc/MetJ family transcription regulator
MDKSRILYSMKTTLDIPEKLLAEAMKAAGATTKRDAVMRALEDFNRRERLRKLTERLGRSDTFMSADELREVRRRRLRGPSTGRTR